MMRVGSMGKQGVGFQLKIKYTSFFIGSFRRVINVIQ
jgi:hypothetical protein